ncbi:MAG: hypothetical protein U0520_04530 [Candidatus Saccharimonadales bacterium]
MYEKSIDVDDLPEDPELRVFFEEAAYLTPIDRSLIASVFASIQERYGNEDSSRYRPYHNHQHALQVMQRAHRICSAFSEAFPLEFDTTLARCLIIAAAWHDFEQMSSDNEWESAVRAGVSMRELGGYDADSEIASVQEGILAGYNCFLE